MATQNTGNIPFALANEPRNYRLIELPAELDHLLSKPGPPTLKLKSLPKGSATGTAAVAHLCTNDKTYTLRSVGTSNSLFVTQSGTTTTQEDGPDEEDGLPQPAVIAVGQCAITLELLPCAESAKDYLRDTLPIWHKTGTAISDEQRWTRPRIYDDIPLSELEIARALCDQCIFENNEGLMLRPAADEILGVWTAMRDVAYQYSLDWAKMDVEALWSNVKEEEYPRALFNAVLARTLGDNGVNVTFDGDFGVEPIALYKSLAITVLEANAVKSNTTTGMPAKIFETAWLDLIPEPLRGSASLEAIDDLIVRLPPGGIALKEQVNAAKKASSSGVTGRKWHDRFNKGR